MILYLDCMFDKTHFPTPLFQNKPPMQLLHYQNQIITRQEFLIVKIG